MIVKAIVATNKVFQILHTFLENSKLVSRILLAHLPARISKHSNARSLVSRAIYCTCILLCTHAHTSISFIIIKYLYTNYEICLIIYSYLHCRPLAIYYVHRSYSLLSTVFIKITYKLRKMSYYLFF